MAHLQRELESSTRGREDAGFLEERIRTLERELEDAGSHADRVRKEAEAAWNVEKASWVSERARFEQERGRWTATAGAAAEVEERMEEERAVWEQEREELVERAKDQIADAADGLRGLIHRFDVPLFSRESGLGVLVDALGRYLEKHNAHVSEQLFMAEVEKRNAIARELEGAKAEIQALQARPPSVVSVFFPFFVVKEIHDLDGWFFYRVARPRLTWSTGHPRQSILPKTQPAFLRYCSHFGQRCHPRKPAPRD
jgi:hypothetical protein